jgi:hypothetical protein
MNAGAQDDTFSGKPCEECEMTSIGIKSLLGIAVLAVLPFTNPAHADEVDPEHRELIRRGNSQVRTGSNLMWTGAALFPVSALALVPVLYDGAFGITAADAGFAIFFAVAGGGLIHAGIPIYGLGADKLERAAGGPLEGPESIESGWSHYRRSWKFMAGGSAVLVAAFPFVAIAALDYQKVDKLDYTAAALAYTGIGLMAIGLLEQHYSLYRFAKSAGNARERLRTRPQVSLQPLFLLDKQGPGAGMRLTCSF